MLPWVNNLYKFQSKAVNFGLNIDRNIISILGSERLRPSVVFAVPNGSERDRLTENFPELGAGRAQLGPQELIILGLILLTWDAESPLIANPNFRSPTLPAMLATTSRSLDLGCDLLRSITDIGDPA